MTAHSRKEEIAAHIEVARDEGAKIRVELEPLAMVAFISSTLKALGGGGKQPAKASSL